MRLHQAHTAEPKKTDVKKSPRPTPPALPAPPAQLLTRVLAMRVQGWPCDVGPWPTPAEQAQAAWRATARRSWSAAAVGEVAVPLIRLTGEFGAPRARRACATLGHFDVRPCPTPPGVSAGRVVCRRAAWEAGCCAPRVACDVDRTQIRALQQPVVVVGVSNRVEAVADRALHTLERAQAA